MIKILFFKDKYISGNLPDGELLLQSVTKFEVNNQNDLSNRRIESGFEITDHSYLKPKQISLSGVVGDINKNPNRLLFETISIPTLGWTKSKSYITDLRDNMEKIRNEKMFVVIYNTKDGKYYENYLLKSLEISDSYKSKNGFEYSMSFQEIVISELGQITTSLSKNAPATNSAKGQGITKDQSKNGIESLSVTLKNKIFTGKQPLTGVTL